MMIAAAEIKNARYMMSNDEVERREVTQTEGTLFQSFDNLLTSPKRRPVAPTDC